MLDMETFEKRGGKDSRRQEMCVCGVILTPWSRSLAGKGLTAGRPLGDEAPAWGAVLPLAAGGLVRGVGGLVWKGWDCQKRRGRGEVF